MTGVVPIETLTDVVHDAKLHARIINVWPAVNPAKGPAPFGMNFVLLDEEGGAIQGLILMKEFNRLRESFREGFLCELRKFAVIPAHPDYPAVPHKFALISTKASSVELLPVPSLNIPIVYLCPMELEDVGKVLTLSSYLMDTVVRIAGFGPVDSVPGRTGQVRVGTMYVTNQRGHTLDVSLWDEFVDAFDVPTLMEKSRIQPVVLACSLLQIRRFEPKLGGPVVRPKDIWW